MSTIRIVNSIVDSTKKKETILVHNFLCYFNLQLEVDFSFKLYVLKVAKGGKNKRFCTQIKIVQFEQIRAPKILVHKKKWPQRYCLLTPKLYLSVLFTTNSIKLKSETVHYCHDHTTRWRSESVLLIYC
jgi:hypothetical protein